MNSPTTLTEIVIAAILAAGTFRGSSPALAVAHYREILAELKDGGVDGGRRNPPNR
jgi:hypothetical protein